MPDLTNLTPFLYVGGFIAFTALIIVLALFLGYQQQQAINRSWDDLAMRTGLTLQKGSLFTLPQLSGEYRHRPLRLYTFSRGSGKSRTTYTAATLTVSNAAGSTLRVFSTNAVFDFFGKLFHAQDVAIGSPEFDARFTIKSSPPDFALSALDDSMVRAGIMDFQGYFRVELEGASLTYTETGVQRDTDYLTKVFNTLSDLADRVDGKKGGSF